MTDPAREAESPVEPPSAPEEPAAEAARLKAELEELRGRNAKLLTQVDELKSLAASTTEGPKDMQRLHLLQIQPVRDTVVFALILGALWLGYALRPITIPLLVALGLAYLVEPAVRYVTGKGWMSRTGAAVTVVLGAALVILVPLGVGGAFAVAQAVQYGDKFRDQVNTLRDSIEHPNDLEMAQAVKSQGTLWGMAHDFIVQARAAAPAKPAETPGPTGATGPPAEPAPSGPPLLTADIKADGAEPGPTGAAARRRNQPLSRQVADVLSDLVQRSGASLGEAFGSQVLGTGGDVLRFAGRLLMASAWALFTLFLILFFFFFFSIGMERIAERMSMLIPKWKRDRTLSMFRQMDAVISGFVRGRLIIMLILMGAFTIGYWVIGVPAPLIVGPIVGVLAVIPYAGLTSIPLCWLLMWMQPATGSEWIHSWWWILFAPAGLYAFIQLCDDYLLNPIIQGRRTDMDTPTILFAVLAGGFLLGFYGMLLAVPVAACLKILIRENFWPRFTAWAEGRVKDFLPISRYDPTETGGSATGESESSNSVGRPATGGG